MSRQSKFALHQTESAAGISSSYHRVWAKSDCSVELLFIMARHSPGEASLCSRGAYISLDRQACRFHVLWFPRSF